MIGVRKEYQETAAFAAGCHLAEDIAWKTLARADNPLTIDSIVSAFQSFGTSTAPWKVEWVLDHAYSRFQRETVGRWGLTIWHLAKVWPYLSKAQLILESAGIPLSVRTLTRLIARCHHREIPFDKFAEKYAQFVYLAGYRLCFLRSWLEWEASGPDQFDLLTAALEPLRVPTPDERMDCHNLIASTMREAGVPVSGGYLAWVLQRANSARDPEMLARILVNGVFFPTWGGHWTLRQLVPSILGNFLGAGHREWEDQKKRIENWKRDTEEQWALEARLLEAVEKAARHANSLLAHSPLSLDDLLTQLELDRFIGQLQEDEVSRLRMLSTARSQLAQAVLSDDTVELPFGKLVRLPHRALRKAVEHLLDLPCALSTIDIATSHLRIEVTEFRRELVSELDQRLGRFRQIQKTGQLWHPTLEELRKRVTPEAREQLFSLMQRSSAPLSPDVARRHLLGLNRKVTVPLDRITRSIAQEILRRDSRFWKLNSGDWWVRPPYLVTGERLAKLKQEGVRPGQWPSVAKLCHILGLDFTLLRPLEGEKVSQAFLQNLRALELPAAQEVKLGLPAAQEVKTEGPEPPPRQAVFTLTKEAIAEGWIAVTPNMRKMVRALGHRGIVEFEVYGSFILQMRLDEQAGRFRGSDLSNWFRENQLEPGHRVYVLFPDRQGEPLRLYTDWQRQISEASPPSGTKRRRPALNLRNHIYEVLQAGDKVLALEQLHLELMKRLGEQVKRTSISATLQRESHLFARWGRSLWGLREWGENWRDHIDDQALLFRIAEEDMVVEILKANGYWLATREIGQEIAERFMVSLDVVLRTTFLDPSDERLVRVADLWGLKQWQRRTISPSKGDREKLQAAAEGLKQWQRRTTSPSLLRALMVFPGFKQVVDCWLLDCTKCSVDDLIVALSPAGIVEGSRS